MKCCLFASWRRGLVLSLTSLRTRSRPVMYIMQHLHHRVQFHNVGTPIDFVTAMHFCLHGTCFYCLLGLDGPFSWAALLCHCTPGRSSPIPFAFIKVFRIGPFVTAHSLWAALFLFRSSWTTVNLDCMHTLSLEHYAQCFSCRHILDTHFLIRSTWTTVKP